MGGGLKKFWLSPPEYIDLKRETKSWDSLDAWVNGGANIAGQAQPVRVTASFVTGGLLQSLGAAPILGRTITPEDDDPKSNAVVDISYGIWQRVFGGRQDIIGKDVELNGQKAVIIGVMPKGFTFPPGEVDPPEVWTALQLGPPNQNQRGSHFLYLLGRLKPNVTTQQAQAEFDSLVKYWGETGSAKSTPLRSCQRSFKPHSGQLSIAVRSGEQCAARIADADGRCVFCAADRLR